MSGTERRLRQKRGQYGENVDGLLPAEEAAITRALYASLQEQKKKSPKKPELAPLSAITRGLAIESLCHVQYSDLSSGSQFESASSTSSCSLISHSDIICPTTPLKRHPSTSVQDHDCPSPFSFGDSIDSPNDMHITYRLPSSQPSSPTGSSDSIGSSLRLVLSTSSWTSSSSSSHWSPSPHLPSSPSSLGSTTSPVAATRRAKGQGRVGQGKLTVHPALFTSPKGSKRGRGKSESHGVASKPGRPPKDVVKGQKAKPSRSSKPPGSKRSPKVKPGKTVLSLSPVSGSSLVGDAPELSLRVKEGEQMEASGSRQESPSGFTAQRKFAHNHLPPNSQRASIKPPSVRSMKEIPKTEDFITFLCLRGSSSMPKSLRKFNLPWTSHAKKRRVRARSSSAVTANSGKGLKSRLGAAKKLDFML